MKVTGGEVEILSRSSSGVIPGIETHAAFDHELFGVGAAAEPGEETLLGVEEQQGFHREALLSGDVAESGQLGRPEERVA